MERSIQVILLSIGLLIAGMSFGQDSKEAKEWKKKADELFDMREFEEAIPYYKDAIGEMPGNREIIFKLGICYLHKPDEHPKAYEYLEEVKAQEPETPGIDFYLGRAYLYSYQFDDAIEHFTMYRNQVKEDDLDELQVVDKYLAKCEEAKKLYETPIKGVIKNAGAVINSKFDEYAPLIPANEDKLIFTYRGEDGAGEKQFFLRDQGYKAPGYYMEDIFISTRAGENFIAPKSISENINTEGNDAAVALSADGQKLYIFKSTLSDAGDIYLSKLNGTTWSEPTKLEGPVNSNYWEGNCALSPDGQYLYFSSQRPGGEGGKDLYRAKLFPDSASSADREFWGAVENLGSTINTAFDEDAPFVHPNGDLLVFSSNGHPGMGGYDIFRSDMDGDYWKSPINVGYPINTTGDDIFFVLTADGKKGYFSSYREGGRGKQDIYTVSPGLPGVSPMLLLSGTVKVDDKLAGAEIHVEYESGEGFGTFEANSATGGFSIPLPAGDHFQIAFSALECSSCEAKTRSIDASGIVKYTEDSIMVNIYSQQYLDQKRQDSLANLNTDTTDSSGGTTDAVDDMGMEHTSAQEYVDEFGNAPPPGYYIIIGSFRNRGNAESLKETMIEEEGVDSCKIMLYEKINFYRVVHSYSDESPEDLRQEYLELQAGDFPRVWILHLE